MYISDGLSRNVKGALRSFVKHPGITSLILASFSVGIGASTLVYSLYSSVLASPFPYRNARRLVKVYIRGPQTAPDDYGRTAVSTETLLRLRERNRVLENMIADSPLEVFYRSSFGALRLNARLVSPDTFEFLGVAPQFGRAIEENDAVPTSAPVFAMSYRLWHKQFNADPGVIGRTFTLGDEHRTLVAVMPPRFLLGDADLWLPISLTSQDPRLKDAVWYPIGRIKAGVTLQQVESDFNLVFHDLSRQSPNEYPKEFTTVAKYLVDDVVRQFRGDLYYLLGAALLLLLISCTDISTLLLVRSSTRRKEFAVRMSIGASTTHIAWQLLMEALILAILSSLCGYALAYLGLRHLLAAIPPDTVPAEADVHLGKGGFAFCAIVASLVTVLVNIAPSIYIVRTNIMEEIKESVATSVASVRRVTFRGVVMVGGVALCVTLLTSAGVLVRSVLAIEGVSLGITDSGVAMTTVTMPERTYRSALERNAAFQKIIERLRTTRGIMQVAQSLTVPPLGGAEGNVKVEGVSASADSASLLQPCNESYFEALQIPLLRGRLFSELDVVRSNAVAIVNNSFVHTFLRNIDPLGARVNFSLLEQFPNAVYKGYFTVVGVVQDSRNRGIQFPPTPQAFIPYTIVGSDWGQVIVKFNGDKEFLDREAHQVIAGVDPELTIDPFQLLTDILTKEIYARPRFNMFIVSLFGILGVGLIVIGIVSVVAYSITVERREIAIRMALGASPGNVLKMIIARYAVLMGVGLTFGLPLGVAIVRFASLRLWGVSSMDPIIVGGAVSIVIVATLISVYIPAHAVMQIDPLVAFKCE